MHSCNLCLDIIKNGDFCKPHSRDYRSWHGLREYYCDRVFMYGSLLFHSFNMIRTQPLHGDTCKDHAKERVRLLNHFSFMADPYNYSNAFYLFEHYTQSNIEYVIRRNPKSQAFTLFLETDIEERLSEVHCEVFLPVGTGDDYNHYDILWTQIPGMPEGFVCAKLLVTSQVDFVLPVLILSQPYCNSSRTALAYQKIWKDAFRDQLILEGFTKLVSNCYGTLNSAYEQSSEYDATKKSDCHLFFRYLLHHLPSSVLDTVQYHLNYLLPYNEDSITFDTVIDISQPAAQLGNPVLSLASVQFLLKIIYLRRNMMALQSNSIHGSLFSAVNQDFSNSLVNNIRDNSPNFRMDNYDITIHSQ